MTLAEKALSELRERIKEHISGKRYSHTLAVEKEISHLCEIFSMSEQETFTMQVAALLHDITKEKNTEEQTALCIVKVSCSLMENISQRWEISFSTAKV